MPVFDKKLVQLKCRIHGGYGIKPVDRDILGEDLKPLFDQGNTAISFVDMPVSHGGVYNYKLVKLQHPPILHERSVTTLTVGGTQSFYK